MAAPAATLAALADTDKPGVPALGADPQATAVAILDNSQKIGAGETAMPNSGDAEAGAQQTPTGTQVQR